MVLTFVRLSRLANCQQLEASHPSLRESLGGSRRDEEQGRSSFCKQCPAVQLVLYPIQFDLVVGQRETADEHAVETVERRANEPGMEVTKAFRSGIPQSDSRLCC